jgi:hypothetical protein
MDFSSSQVFSVKISVNSAKFASGGIGNNIITHYIETKTNTR